MGQWGPPPAFWHPTMTTTTTEARDTTRLESQVRFLKKFYFSPNDNYLQVLQAITTTYHHSPPITTTYNR